MLERRGYTMISFSHLTSRASIGDTITTGERHCSAQGYDLITYWKARRELFDLLDRLLCYAKNRQSRKLQMTKYTDT